MSPIPLGILAAAGAGGGSAMELIASVTTSGNTSTVAFNNISQDYTHLYMTTSWAIDNNGELALQVNNDTNGNNYNYGMMRYTTSLNVRNQPLKIQGATRIDYPSVGDVWIPNYTITQKAKNGIWTAMASNFEFGTSKTSRGNWVYEPTSPITAVSFTASTSLKNGSKFILYGVL